jgi:uncharacterized membrane protein (TIGR02234 family)
MGRVSERAEDGRFNPRRLYGPVLLFGLAGALGVTVGTARPWVSATSAVPDLPTLHSTASGGDLAPLAGALGVVLLAAFGAVVATRGWFRRALGAVIVVASLAVLIAVIAPGSADDVLRSGLAAKGWSGAAYQTHPQVWRWLVLASAVVTSVAGVATLRYGDQWAVMGDRYDAPGSRGPAAAKPSEELTENDVWQAIDHGDDPTQGR